ncbi:hypothetical protein [Anabaena azotica]|uniref:Uncharacterized protein n=1 Tax=Anabaena azotica FACHB-119 TaxID=947527 RepID=A0ABR8DAD0_9NOST|nr:hypothetical protein [Anabaena azotica]MBD2503152.1 hypothetical protein [Anabaena azotica FACHB-119]
MNDNQFNQEEFDRYKAAFCQLNNKKTIPLVISEQVAFFLVAQLQLAFRHPNNIGAARDAVRESIQPIVDYFTGDVREILERGFHLEFDLDVNNTPQPDPVWDYYDLWITLHEGKQRIDEMIAAIADKEQADIITDNNVRELLTKTVNDFDHRLRYLRLS